MTRTAVMVASLLMSMAFHARNAAKVPVQLVLTGPKSVKVGEPLPLHLKLKNISMDQRIRIVEGCLRHHLAWKIHANNGKSVRPGGVEVDCTGSEDVLEPGQERDWAVDPSAEVVFPGSGNYFITAVYTFDEPGSLGGVETPRSVDSNTLIVSVR